MGHCSKSKVHHWDWAKMLLYRWPRLMSSVCAPLMLAASREQTASHRVRGNKDDNDTRNMVGCGYVNHRHLVAVYCSLCVYERLTYFSSTTICLQFLAHLYSVSHTHTRTRVNRNVLSLLIDCIYIKQETWHMRKKWIVDPMFSSETLLPYCFWGRAFMGSFNKGRCVGLWCADGGGRLGLCCWIPDGCIQGEQITFSVVFTSPPLFHVNSAGSLISCPSWEAGSHCNFILAAVNANIFASEIWHEMIKWGNNLARICRAAQHNSI